MDGPEARTLLQGGIEGLAHLESERRLALEEHNPWLRRLLATSDPGTLPPSAASSSSSSSNSSGKVRPIPWRGQLVPGQQHYYVVVDSDSQEEGAEKNANSSNKRKKQKGNESQCQ